MARLAGLPPASHANTPETAQCRGGIPHGCERRAPQWGMRVLSLERRGSVFWWVTCRGFVRKLADGKALSAPPRRNAV